MRHHHVIYVCSRHARSSNSVAYEALRLRQESNRAMLKGAGNPRHRQSSVDCIGGVWTPVHPATAAGRLAPAANGVGSAAAAAAGAAPGATLQPLSANAVHPAGQCVAVAAEASAESAYPQPPAPTWFDDSLLGMPVCAWSVGAGASIAFSPCCSYLAVGSRAGLVEVWDVRIGKKVVELAVSEQVEKEHSLTEVDTQKKVMPLLWGAGGRSLLFGIVAASEVAETPHGSAMPLCSDGVVSSAGHGAQRTCVLHHLHVPGRLVSDEAFEDEGHMYSLPPIHVPLHALGEAKDCIHTAALSPDGDTLVAATDHGLLHVWELTHGTWRPALQMPLGVAEVDWTLALARRGHPQRSRELGRLLAATGSFSKGVSLWDLEPPHQQQQQQRGGGQCPGALLGTLDHSQGVFALAMTADGTVLVSGASDGMISIYDTSQLGLDQEGVGTSEVALCPLRAVYNQDGAIYSLAMTPCGGGAVSGDASGWVKFWDVATGVCHAMLQLGGQEEVTDVVVAANGRLVAAVLAGGNVAVWRLK